MNTVRPLLCATCAAISAIAIHAYAGPPATEDPLKGLRFLAGSCWQGTFPDGESVDTHCYESFYDGAFIRDRHTVRGPNPDYHGESIYHWDPEKAHIVYRYWNSQGGVSDGTAEVAGNKVHFPGERHVRDDGSVVELQSVIERVGPDRYVSTTEELRDGRWQEIWRMEFSRVGEASAGMPEMPRHPDSSVAGTEN